MAVRIRELEPGGRFAEGGGRSYRLSRRRLVVVGSALAVVAPAVDVALAVAVRSALRAAAGFAPRTGPCAASARRRPGAGRDRRPRGPLSCACRRTAGGSGVGRHPPAGSRHEVLGAGRSAGRVSSAPPPSIAGGATGPGFPSPLISSM